MEKNAEKILANEPPGRPLETDPIEDQIRYDIFESAKLSGMSTSKCEERVQQLIKQYYQEKENSNNG